MLRKRLALLQRRTDLAFAEFDAHWATGHAEIISQLPGMEQYVQNPVHAYWTNGDPSATIDGVVEVWFDDAAVAAPEAHTSMAQQEDEVRFIRTLTAFTVTNRATYEAEAKVWLLSPVPMDARHLASLGPGALVAEPESGILMERPRLLREPAAPATIAVLPVPADAADSAFDAAVRSLADDADAPTGLRVLKTVSRRVH